MPKRSGRPWVSHFRNLVIACVECNNRKNHRMPTDIEIKRLIALKRPYADVDYDLSAVEAEPRTDWLNLR